MQRWQDSWPRCRPLLLLAATGSAEQPGLSAAGATPAARRRTAAADAELLLQGPDGARPHALPPLPAGVSPALISHAGLRRLGLLPRCLVVDLGCPVAPAVPHLRLPPPAGDGPAACVSTGSALSSQRLEALLQRGRRWGERWPAEEPLLLAECVPGGTSTALAVLLGLGIAAQGLVSGSLRRPAHGRKESLARQGLTAAGLFAKGPSHPGPTASSPTDPSPPVAPATAQVDPRRVLAAVGDPMQALAAGLLLGLAEQRSEPLAPVLLAGGSQMAAVLALALALLEPERRQRLAATAVVGTTAWVAHEPHSNLRELLNRIGAHWQVRPQLAVADLRFHGCSSAALRDYERGYVKEGVGAGGVALLWQWSGRTPAALAAACDADCRVLLGGEDS